MADDSLLQDDDETIRLPRTLLSIGTNNNAINTSSSITPLEQQVLDEYQRLLSNMNQVMHAFSPLPSLSSTIFALIPGKASTNTHPAHKNPNRSLKRANNAGDRRIVTTIREKGCERVYLDEGECV